MAARKTVWLHCILAPPAAAPPPSTHLALLKRRLLLPQPRRPLLQLQPQGGHLSPLLLQPRHPRLQLLHRLELCCACLARLVVLLLRVALLPLVLLLGAGPGSGRRRWAAEELVN